MMEIDTLIIAIVQPDDADAAIRALTRAGFEVTVIASAGGFLRARNVTLLIGLQAGEVERALASLKAHCHRRAVNTPVPTHIGGATIFVLSIARYVHLGSDHVIVDAQHAASAPGALQMILTIVPQEQSQELIETLTEWSYHVTHIGTAGGFWRRGNATLLVGVRSERVDAITEQIRRVCETSAAEPRATIFVANIARLEHVQPADGADRLPT